MHYQNEKLGIQQPPHYWWCGNRSLSHGGNINNYFRAEFSNFQLFLFHFTSHLNVIYVTYSADNIILRVLHNLNIFLILYLSGQKLKLT